MDCKKINLISYGCIALSSLISIAIMKIDTKSTDLCSNAKLVTTDKPKHKSLSKNNQVVLEEDEGDDPMDVITSDWNGCKVDQYEDDVDEDDDDDEIIDMDEINSIDIAESLANAFPDGLMVYEPIEEEDDDEDIDFDNFKYEIPGSRNIIDVNGTVFDFEMIRDYLISAKSYYEGLLKGESKIINGVEERTEEEIRDTNTDDIPDEMDNESVMDYLVRIDPYDIVNRKTIFGERAPDRKEYQPKKVELSEEEKSMIDMKNRNKYHDFKIVEKKLFMSADTSLSLRNFLENCKYVTNHGDQQSIDTIMDEYNMLVHICANSIENGQKINRRSWNNRFQKIFSKAKKLVDSINHVE